MLRILFIYFYLIGLNIALYSKILSNNTILIICVLCFIYFQGLLTCYWCYFIFICVLVFKSILKL